MKHSIALLKKELAEWQEHNNNEKEFFKAEENDPLAISSLRECVEHISDLQKSIEIIESEDLLNELPDNRPLYRDSGSWQIRSDNMEDVLFQQASDESFYSFIKRCYEQQNKLMDI